MHGLAEIREMNGTPVEWKHTTIVFRNGRYCREETDGSLSLCPWEEIPETNTTNRKTSD